MKTWFWLFAAGSAEAGWVAGINAADSALEWSATGLCIVASFGLALLAARHMAATTVYVIFVGLGATGTFALDVAIFHAALHPATLAWLALLLAAIIGLKISSRPARTGEAS